MTEPVWTPDGGYGHLLTDSGIRPMTEAEIYVRLEELRTNQRQLSAEWRALLAMLHPLKDEATP